MDSRFVFMPHLHYGPELMVVVSMFNNFAENTGTVTSVLGKRFETSYAF